MMIESLGSETYERCGIELKLSEELSRVHEGKDGEGNTLHYHAIKTPDGKVHLGLGDYVKNELRSALAVVYPQYKDAILRGEPEFRMEISHPIGTCNAIMRMHSTVADKLRPILAQKGISLDVTVNNAELIAADQKSIENRLSSPRIPASPAPKVQVAPAAVESWPSYPRLHRETDAA